MPVEVMKHIKHVRVYDVQTQSLYNITTKYYYVHSTKSSVLVPNKVPGKSKVLVRHEHLNMRLLNHFTTFAGLIL